MTALTDVLLAEMKLRHGTGPIPNLATSTATPIDWFAKASAISSPEGLWLLDHLVNDGALSFQEFEAEKLGAAGAVGLGQLMRAGYLVEGTASLHVTDIGRLGYAAFMAKHPEFDAP